MDQHIFNRSGELCLPRCFLAEIFFIYIGPSPDDHDDDLDGEFWARHRAIETVLLNTALGLPDYLWLSFGLSDPNVVFLKMSLYILAICLHQGAISKVVKQRLPVNVSNESKI